MISARTCWLLPFAKGAVLAHRLVHPLAAELDEYEQRRHAARSVTPAAPLIAGVFTRQGLTPAQDEEQGVSRDAAVAPAIRAKQHSPID